MTPHFFRQWLLVLAMVLLCATANCFAKQSLKIDPEMRTGPIVRYFGWDTKLHANLCNSRQKAQWLYGESPANIMRIPFRPQASTPDGKAVFSNSVKEKGYGALIDSIRMAKKVNPDIKIFASTKLMGAKTFPDWMCTNETGKIFNATVRCPDVRKFTNVLIDFIEHLADRGIKIDFLGINNELGGVITTERYTAIARLLEANLKRSSIPDEFKDFQWVGAEEFGVPGSVKHARKLAKSSGAKFVDVLGSHFYPDKESGSIKNWAELSSLGVPTWHTEVHIRRDPDPRKNIRVLRDGLAIVFKTNQVGCQGYVFWDGTANKGFLCNRVRHKLIESMLYGCCVQTAGDYKAKDNEPGKRIAQATRVGDTVWVWCFNPNEAVREIPVELANGTIESASAFYFQGGSKVSPDSVGELSVKSLNKRKISIEKIPGNGIVVARIQLEDDEELIPLKKWQRVKPRRILEASLAGVESDTLIFKSRRGKLTRVPLESISPIHLPEIEDSLKAHRISP